MDSVFRRPIDDFPSARLEAGMKAFARPVAAQPADQDEARLVEAVKAGNAAAFDELANRHMRRAFGVAFRLLGQRQEGSLIF